MRKLLFVAVSTVMLSGAASAQGLPAGNVMPVGPHPRFVSQQAEGGETSRQQDPAERRSASANHGTTPNPGPGPSARD